MSRKALRSAAAVLATCSAACTAPAPSRLDAFEATLAGQHSATAALTGWCARNRIADPPVVTARPIAGNAPPPDANARKWLEVPEGAELGYRHVALTCGDTVLSQAHNWFVPGRLTDEMNRVLQTSDTPFGKVARSLDFRRERLASTRGAAPGCPPDTILAHRAVLRLPDGRPISFVIECYSAANLAR